MINVFRKIPEIWIASTDFAPLAYVEILRPIENKTEILRDGLAQDMGKVIGHGGVQ